MILIHHNIITCVWGLTMLSVYSVKSDKGTPLSLHVKS